MMYHFILGLRGFSATAAAVSDCGASASVVASFLVSSCIVNPNLAFREVLNQIGHAATKRVIYRPEIERKYEYGDDHNGRGRLHFLARRACDLAHFGAHVVVKGLDSIRPGLDPS